jgi:hypothetical protein
MDGAFSMNRCLALALLTPMLVNPLSVAAQAPQDAPQPNVEQKASPKSAPDGPSVNRSISGPAGRDIRIAVFASLRADCSAGSLPSIKLQGQPKHGKVNVRQGKMRATNHKKCLAVEIPAFIVFYRANPDFEGQDEVALEVVSGSKRQLHKITVTVTGPKGSQRI